MELTNKVKVVNNPDKFPINVGDEGWVIDIYIDTTNDIEVAYVLFPNKAGDAPSGAGDFDSTDLEITDTSNVIPTWVAAELGSREP